MKQIHKLKEMNRKLEDALKKIDALSRERRGQFGDQIRVIVAEALDKKGNHK